MIEAINKLEELLKKGVEYLSQASDEELSRKLAPEKWSKKEILGHLIDSGISNLQRFTEIQFEIKPYRIRNYKQEELVEANNYQNADSQEIIDFWFSINMRVVKIIERQTNDTLNFKIELGENNISDLRFLIKDYVDHLEHHLNQILA